MSDTKESRKLPSAYAIFGLTALGYADAFVFQVSYLGYFNISYKFVEISIPLLVISIAATIFAAFSWDNLSGPYREIMSGIDFDNPMQRFFAIMVRWVAFAIVPLCMLLFGISASPRTTLYILGPFLLLTALSLFPPISYLRKEKSFRGALAVMYAEKEAKRKDRKARNVETYGERYNRYVMSMGFLLILATVAGKMYATTQSNLYVIDHRASTKSLLILKSGTTLITRDYNVNARQFEPGFSVTQMQGTLNLKERVFIGKER